MIDTHCHLDFNAYDEDRADVVERARAAGVDRIINPAIDPETSRAIVALTQTYDGVYGAVGIHPNSTASFTPEHLEPIEALASRDKIVAIGEIGLDYYRDRSPKERQWAAFEAQLTLAARLEMPVIIHNRDAGEDVISILENWVKSLPETLRERPGVLHSFSAPAEIAERALAAGFYLGFTGPITFKNADDLRQIAARVPLDRLLVETDGPFLTPTPYRGKRNEPAYIPYIVERLASLHRLSIDDMARMTTENAERLFALPT
ncbi:MAG: TatD family hydrolase [Chloroflexota bacterium]|nr:MAG: hydrolase TatD [Chloroflexota bacterium]